MFDHTEMHDHLSKAVDGILLPGTTIDDMRQGVSKIRNHVVAPVFRELNLIEQWGSGIPRILRETKELALSEMQKVAQTFNAELALLYWHAGRHIRQDILKKKRAAYVQEIVAAVRRQLG